MCAQPFIKCIGQHFFGRRFGVAISDNFNSDGAAEAASTPSVFTKRLRPASLSPRVDRSTHLDSSMRVIAPSGTPIGGMRP